MNKVTELSINAISAIAAMKKQALHANWKLVNLHEAEALQEIASMLRLAQQSEMVVEKLKSQNTSREETITINGHDYTVYLEIRDVSTEFGGQVVHQYTILQPMNTCSNKEIKEALAEKFDNFYKEGFGCHHEYDCCGNYYPSNPRINTIPDSMTIITQGFTQNV